jgi:DNA-binding CsgD family transcriptional regulator
MNNRIPAGIIDKGTEFFTVIEDNMPRAKFFRDGASHPFSALPQLLKTILHNDMVANPAKEREIEAMVGSDMAAKLEKFTTCNYGRLDDEADIDEHGNLSQPEYVPCPYRGTCKHEGKACSNILINGVLLSRAETEVFKLTKFSNDEIAAKLFRSVKTVKTQIQTIQNKSGLANKIEMVHLATIKGII